MLLFKVSNEQGTVANVPVPTLNSIPALAVAEFPFSIIVLLINTPVALFTKIFTPAVLVFLICNMRWVLVPPVGTPFILTLFAPFKAIILAPDPVIKRGVVVPAFGRIVTENVPAPIPSSAIWFNAIVPGSVKLEVISAEIFPPKVLEFKNSNNPPTPDNVV